MKKNNIKTITNLTKVLIAVLALFLFNIDKVKAQNVTRVYNYGFTNTQQSFTAPYSAKYKIELWGAQGGSVYNSRFGNTAGGNGAYTSGTIYLSAGETIFIHVGQHVDVDEYNLVMDTFPTYGGGGHGSYSLNYEINAPGGGATDVRLVNSNWYDAQGANSRIMVAGGGGGSTSNGFAANGGVGGWLAGGEGNLSAGTAQMHPAYGGSQVWGGLDAGDKGGAYRGVFNQGGYGPREETTGVTWYYVSGGGGGYYGGGSGNSAVNGGRVSSAAGGSSYVSGYGGAIAVQSQTDSSPKAGCYDGVHDPTAAADITCSYHYSGKIFENPIIIAGSASMPNHAGTGTMVGNAGHGYAKITIDEAKYMLKNITITPGKGYLTTSFDKNETDYVWIVPKYTPSFSAADVTATAFYSAPQTTIVYPNGAVPFTQDGDKFIIQAIADDGSSQAYTLTMKRAVSSDARLSNITSNKGQLSTAFNPDLKNYSLFLYEDTDTVTLGATALEQDNKGIIYTYGSTSNATGVINLTEDETDVNIVSTAEDGTVDTYRVHIVKNMYLQGIEVQNLENYNCESGQCVVSPTFSPEGSYYTIKVPLEYENLKVGYTPSKEDLRVGITVNGQQYQVNQTLTKIKTTIVFNIYGKSNTIIRSYSLDLIRENRTSVKLKDLRIKEGKGYIEETFDKNKTDYTWVIPKGTTQVSRDDIIATLFDSTSDKIIPATVPFTQDGDQFTITVNAKTIEDYGYTGNYREFEAPYTGRYKIEAWGAQGGGISFGSYKWTNGGKGAYTSGIITLNEGDKLYIYVGQNYNDVTTDATWNTGVGTWNGGGHGSWSTHQEYSANGGGATDIRLVPANWWDTGSLASRIMVAGGGGGSTSSGYPADGGPGGTLVGGDGLLSGYNTIRKAQGGGQTYGGLGAADNYGTFSGYFGIGGTSTIYSGEPWYYVAGGGGGYFGGGAGGATRGIVSSGAGGSSYISGYQGAVAVKSQNDISPKAGCAQGTIDVTCSYHYSGKVFTDTVMKAGNQSMPTYNGGETMVGNTGNGHAKITLLDSNEIMLSNTYTITLKEAESDDARLATLTATTPSTTPNFPNGFDPNQTDPVIIEVYKNVFEITLDGTTMEPDATIIDGLGTIELNEDEVEHTITVQAENGTIRTYDVIIRKNMYIEDMGLTPTSLQDKACKAGECVLEPTFDEAITDYFIKVPVDYDNLYAYYTLPDVHHTSVMTVDGNPYVDGYELPVEGTVVVKVDVYNDDPNNNQIVKTYTMRVIKEIEYIQEFEYTGDYQVFIAPFTGKYKMETWGASGGNTAKLANDGLIDHAYGGKGSYASGYINLTKGERLYIYVGGQGTGTAQVGIGQGGYNGGGDGQLRVVQNCFRQVSGGGGATDIRLVSGNWNSTSSLASRIMVAGGGGGTHQNNCNESNYSIIDGGAGGDLTGGAGVIRSTGGFTRITPTGGTQTTGGMSAGGTSQNDWRDSTSYTTAYIGLFGQGSTLLNPSTEIISSGGGGGGYYGGATGVWKSGGGGSSFISGYLGSVAVTSENDITPKSGCADQTNDITCSYHYSGKVFTNGVMKNGTQDIPTYDGTGTMTGNTGNGYAKISYIPEPEDEKTEFDYTGDYQVFIAPATGKYKLETWGASGGNTYDFAEDTLSDHAFGGRGGYSSGVIELKKDEVLYIYVGGQGTGTAQIGIGQGGYNGGGDGQLRVGNCYRQVSGGGGATDIRLVSGNWNSTPSLASRIMVAGGGGGTHQNYCSETNYSIIDGGSGGDLTGGAGVIRSTGGFTSITPTGGTQTTGGMSAGGTSQNDWRDSTSYTTAYIGLFGQGSTLLNPSTEIISSGGGGGGYYGGATGVWKSGGGGSSFISGHPGAVAITGEEDLTPKTGSDSNVHYSGKVFTDTVMKAGNELMPSPDGVTTEVGNVGNGHAAITLIEVEVKLDSLTVDYGSLTDPFDKDQNDYTWIVPKNHTSIDTTDIHYEPSNPGSTVTDTLPMDDVKDGDVIEITVTGDDGVTTNVYTLTIEIEKSTENRLKSLTTDMGIITPIFDPDTDTYVIEVYEDTDVINIDGEPMSEYASVTGFGEIELDSSEVTRNIIVTSEDGNTKTYTAIVRTEFYLLSIGLNGLDGLPCIDDECSLIPSFEMDNRSYTMKVPYEYDSLDAYYILVNYDNSVEIKVNDSTYTQGQSLPVGETEVKYLVYNKDDVLINTYTMNVIRQKGSYATLESLEVSVGDLNIPFDKETTEYIWILPDNVSTNLEEYVTYTKTDPDAIAAMVPEEINYTQVGDSFDIVVTAEDGVTTKKYTVILQQDFIENIEVNENMTIMVGETKNLYINGLPEGSVGKYLYEVDQSAIAYVYDNGDVYGIFPGETDVTISVKNHPEIDAKVVHITVIEDKITSSILSVEDRDLARIIIGEEPGVNVDNFLDKLDNPREYLEVYDLEDNLISSDDYDSVNVYTGLKVKLVIDSVIHDEAIVIIRGDIDGDGIISVSDEAMLTDHILTIDLINDYRKYAADVEEDDLLDVVDDSLITDYILGIIDSLNE